MHMCKIVCRLSKWHKLVVNIELRAFLTKHNNLKIYKLIGIKYSDRLTISLNDLYSVCLSEERFEQWFDIRR